MPLVDITQENLSRLEKERRQFEETIGGGNGVLMILYPKSSRFLI